MFTQAVNICDCCHHQREKKKENKNHGIAPTTPLFAQRTQREVCNAPIPVENKTKLNPRTK